MTHYAIMRHGPALSAAFAKRARRNSRQARADRKDIGKDAGTCHREALARSADKESRYDGRSMKLGRKLPRERLLVNFRTFSFEISARRAPGTVERD